MVIHVPTLKRIDILLHHQLLGLICTVLLCLLEVRIAFLKIWSELAILDVKFLAFELNITSGPVFGDATDCHGIFIFSFEGSCGKDVNLLVDKEFLDEL